MHPNSARSVDMHMQTNSQIHGYTCRPILLQSARVPATCPHVPETHNKKPYVEAVTTSRAYAGICKVYHATEFVMLWQQQIKTCSMNKIQSCTCTCTCSRRTSSHMDYWGSLLTRVQARKYHSIGQNIKAEIQTTTTVSVCPQTCVCMGLWVAR